MLQVLIAISQNFCCRKEAYGYVKVIHKKRERERKKERIEKSGQVFDIFKTMGTQMPVQKKDK